MRSTLTIAFVLAIATPVFATTYTIDPVHSSVHFTVRHMMVSNVHGNFGKVTGTASWDGNDLKTAKVEAVLDASAIDTHEPKRDGHLKSPDFLDVAKFPTLTFKSKKVEPAGAGKAKITGDLTLHGVTKEVVLEATVPATPIKDQQGVLHTGASATTKISRKDFGLVWNHAIEGGGVLVGDEVNITLDVELASAAPAKK